MKRVVYFIVCVVTTVPGLALQVCSLGAFDYIDKMERMQAWAERRAK